jgi:hypothetical protein
MTNPTPPAPKRSGRKEISIVRAMFAYKAQRNDEISFNEGDVL